MNINIANTIECLPCARHRSKHFTFTGSFNPYKKPLKYCFYYHFTDETVAQRGEMINSW